MSGKSLAAALLLPLPFAALPLAALLFTADHTGPRVAIREDMATIQLVPEGRVSPLALNVAGSPRDGCPHASISPIEG